VSKLYSISNLGVQAGELIAVILQRSEKNESEFRGTRETAQDLQDNNGRGLKELTPEVCEAGRVAVGSASMPAPAQNQPENPSGAQGVPVGTARGASKAVLNGRSATATSKRIAR
jgi:hypothetical protein